MAKSLAIVAFRDMLRVIRIALSTMWIKTKGVVFRRLVAFPAGGVVATGRLIQKLHPESPKKQHPLGLVGAEASLESRCSG